MNNQRENYHEKVHQIIFERKQAYKNLIHSVMKIVEDFNIQKTKENEEKRKIMQINEKIIEIRSIKLNADIKDDESEILNEFNNDDVEKAFMITLSTVEKSNENDMKN